MPVRFFGQYLLANRIVTREQLLEGVSFQTKHNLRLGDYALKLGWVSQTNVDRIYQLQRLRDFKFGEAAIVLQILTPAQVTDLLEQQHKDHLYLGDTLVQLGYADQASIHAALDAFCAEQAQYSGDKARESDFEGPDAACYAVCVELTHKMLLRVWGVPSKVGAPQARETSVTLSGFISAISFTGGFTCRYVIAVPEDVARAGARTIMEPNQINGEICEDMVREFANVVCGNVCASLAQIDRCADISPPESLSGSHHTSDRSSVRTGDRSSVRVPIVTPYGEVVVVLAAG